MKAHIFLAAGFEEIEAISIIDTLRRAEVEVETVSISTNKQVLGAHNIEISADTIFDNADYSNTQMLILPGGQPGADNLNKHQKLKTLIQHHHNQNKHIAAICAAPLIFGKMGLLQGKRAICYPGYETQLVGATIAQNENVVVHKNIITGKAPGAAIEFALTLAEILAGKDTTEKLRNAMIVT